MKITISTPYEEEEKRKRCQKVGNKIDILLTKISAIPPKKRDFPRFDLILWPLIGPREFQL